MYKLQNNHLTLQLIEDHTAQSFSNGYFIESLQGLHGSIESQLQTIALILGDKNQNKYKADYEVRWNTSNELSYLELSKTLLVLGIISRKTFNKLKTFNQTRNKMIHDLFKQGYEGQMGLRLSEVKNNIQIGLSLVHDLRRIVDGLMTK